MKECEMYQSKLVEAVSQSTGKLIVRFETEEQGIKLKQIRSKFKRCVIFHPSNKKNSNKEMEA